MCLLIYSSEKTIHYGPNCVGFHVFQYQCFFIVLPSHSSFFCYFIKNCMLLFFGLLICTKDFQNADKLGQTVEKQRGCLEKFPLGRSRGYLDCPERRSPKGQYEYPKEIFQDILRLFHSFSNFEIHIQAEDKAKSLPEENPMGGSRLFLGSIQGSDIP